MKQYILYVLIGCVSMACAQSTENATVKVEKEIQFKKLDSAELYGGSLYRVNKYPSKYIKPRPVDVWLPDNFSASKKYAVLYMHDGQNLFDSTTTWNKQEWKVDEWATKLMNSKRTKDFIVVGVHNIAQIRYVLQAMDRMILICV